MNDGACLAALRKHWGYGCFRPMQLEAVQAPLAGRDCFVRMATGGGKSLCYQVPGAMAPEGKFTLVVSPLVALMQDQVEGLNARGLSAVYLGRSQTDEDAVRNADKRYKFVYVTPELLQTPGFRERLRDQCAGRVWLVAVDEAHCVSTWGHDFRPAYAQLGEVRAAVGRGVPVMALTATACSRVQMDVVSTLGLAADHVAVSTSVDRPNLHYEVRCAPTGGGGSTPLDAAVSEMASYVDHDASTIVYASTIADVEKLAQAFVRRGMPCEHYHAQMPIEDRRRVLTRFRNDDVHLVVATVAFGMGIDKPDVRSVLHYTPPDSVQDYYQQSGRAGRDGDPARCVVWVAPGTWAKKMSHETKARREAAESAAAEGDEPSSSLSLTTARPMGAWREMRRYCEMRVCRRKTLAAAFGEVLPTDCGVCDVCREPSQEATDAVDATDAARSLLAAAAACGGVYGASTVVSVALGTIGDKDRRHRLRGLPCFGTGRPHVRDAETGQRLLAALRIAGLVEDSVRTVSSPGAPSSYLAVRLTDAGVRWLDQGVDSTFRTGALLASKDAAAGAASSSSRLGDKKRHRLSNAPPLADADAATVGRLRVLRKTLAIRDGVAPFFVMSDATMRNLATSGASRHSDLLAVHGIGEKTALKYGREFLEVLRSTDSSTGGVA
jgi:ATP-dependent DNA helicase RecQ